MNDDVPTKMRMLDTADQLFYRQGLRAVGVDEIVARSGVAKTTLYAHFKSKDLLIAAYLQRRSEASRRFLQGEAQKVEGDAGAQIETVFSLIAQGCASDSFRGCPFVNFAVEFPDRSHPAWPVCLEYRNWVHQFFASILRSGGAARPEYIASQLCLLYDAMMIGGLFDEEGQSAAVTRETVATLMQMALPGPK
jgi:AcrR family transcriptional regulator